MGNRPVSVLVRIPNTDRTMPILEQRKHARLKYARPSRTGLFLDTATLPLVDCSQVGIRVQLSKELPPPEVGSMLTGIVWFRHGDTAPVAGKVVRVTDEEVAATLDDVGIPIQSLLAEAQFFLRSRRGLRW
jgi:hypothetical protein